MTQDITAAVSRVICPGYLRISGPCPGYNQMLQNHTSIYLSFRHTVQRAYDLHNGKLTYVLPMWYGRALCPWLPKPDVNLV